MRQFAACGLLLAVVVFSPAAAQTQEPKDRVQYGQDIEVGAGETARDVVCIGCSIRVLGKVAGDAVAVGGSLAIEGTVEGDAVAVAGVLRLGPNARVGEDAVAAGGRLERAPGAQVGRDAVSTPFIPSLPVTSLAQLILFFFLIALVTNLVLVLLAYLLAGRTRVETMATTVRERAGLAALTGIGVLVGAVLLYIISAMMGPLTAVLAILVSVALGVTLVVGYAGLSFWMGRLLAPPRAGLASSWNPLAVVLLGVLLITLLQFIPILGGLVFLVFLLLALGCAALSGFGTSTDWLPRQFATRPAVPPASAPPAS